MVAAINAGLEQKLFGLRPGENWWHLPVAELEPWRSGSGAIFRFTFPGGAPALAWVGETNFDELFVHVALWPTDDAERWVSASNAGSKAGEVCATGWLERQIRPCLQTSKTFFAAAHSRVSIVAAAQFEPLGYADRGVLQL